MKAYTYLLSLCMLEDYTYLFAIKERDGGLHFLITMGQDEVRYLFIIMGHDGGLHFLC